MLHGSSHSSDSTDLTASNLGWILFTCLFRNNSMWFPPSLYLSLSVMVWVRVWTCVCACACEQAVGGGGIEAGGAGTDAPAAAEGHLTDGGREAGAGECAAGQGDGAAGRHAAAGAAGE